MFLGDYLLGDIQVKGEVSNCKYHQSGHVYFTLKDEKAAINCAMFAGNRAGLAFSMKDGDNVTVSGYIDVYEKAGTYQLYARKIKREGAGALYEKFLALKAELEEMGMFSPDYKKPVPEYASRIGVVTAPTGAAIRDIQNILKRRNPGVLIVLYPAIVQGEGAAAQIAAGIKALDRYGVDVIIAGRGGGSIEDLWAFNEETVARAIFDCNTPVISAVGHETDVTIADFVADLRAPTPSAAAELASADIPAVMEKLNILEKRLHTGMDRSLERTRSRLDIYKKQLVSFRPDNVLALRKEKLKAIKKLIYIKLRQTTDENKHALELLTGRLNAASPQKKLSDGFAWLADSGGRPVASVKNVKKGDMLKIVLKDGLIDSEVIGTAETKPEGVR